MGADPRSRPPRDRVITANRLDLHLLEWGEAGPVVLLLHGFLEHAHVWDWVAPQLASAGYHVCALDWRGHGDSEWIGAGGYYHFIDYVADLAGVVRALGGRVVLVGHSMGGGAAVLYAGTEPQRVQALVSIEGLGVPDSEPQAVPERVVGWLQDLERAAQRVRGTIGFDAAVQRLHERFPRFPDAVARHLVETGTRAVAGARMWKFDPLHQTRAPQPTYVAQARAFWTRVACPVLYIEGAESALRLPPADVDERLRALRARRVTIPGSGHHPHLEQPDLLAQVLIDFLSGLSREATGSWGRCANSDSSGAGEPIDPIGASCPPRSPIGVHRRFRLRFPVAISSNRMARCDKENVVPTVFTQEGFRFHFYSNERNEPPHIHVTGKGGEMKIWLPSLAVEFSFGLSPPEQRRVMEIAKENVTLLMERWNEFSRRKG
jgi:pimeloyl-ACP methyl ester carboxylesterase